MKLLHRIIGETEFLLRVPREKSLLHATLRPLFPSSSSSNLFKTKTTWGIRTLCINTKSLVYLNEIKLRI